MPRFYVFRVPKPPVGVDPAHSNQYGAVAVNPEVSTTSLLQEGLFRLGTTVMVMAVLMDCVSGQLWGVH